MDEERRSSNTVHSRNTFNSKRNSQNENQRMECTSPCDMIPDKKGAAILFGDKLKSSQDCSKEIKKVITYLLRENSKNKRNHT